jgi:hypothetical protein
MIYIIVCIIDFMEFLTGKDYPHLCPACQIAVDNCLDLVMFGSDTDDPEAPCMYAYDHNMFCGGSSCDNRTDD